MNKLVTLLAVLALVSLVTALLKGGLEAKMQSPRAAIERSP